METKGSLSQPDKYNTGSNQKVAPGRHEILLNTTGADERATTLGIVLTIEEDIALVVKTFAVVWLSKMLYDSWPQGFYRK